MATSNRSVGLNEIRQADELEQEGLIDSATDEKAMIALLGPDAATYPDGELNELAGVARMVYEFMTFSCPIENPEDNERLLEVTKEQDCRLGEILSAAIQTQDFSTIRLIERVSIRMSEPEFIARWILCRIKSLLNDGNKAKDWPSGSSEHRWLAKLEQFQGLNAGSIMEVFYGEKSLKEFRPTNRQVGNWANEIGLKLEKGRPKAR